MKLKILQLLVALLSAGVFLVTGAPFAAAVATLAFTWFLVDSPFGTRGVLTDPEAGAAQSWANAKGAAKRVVSALEKAQPFKQVIGKRLPFNGNIKRVGKSYLVPVVMQPPNGVTYIGKDPTATSLKAGRPMNIQEAEAFSYETDVMEQTPWAVFQRQADNEQAVEAYLQVLMMFLKRTAQTRKEVSMLLGQYSGGLGTVASVVDNTTYMTIGFTAATWRGGLWWALGPGATLDSFTGTTKNNATGPLILIGVNPTNKTIDCQFSGTAASECAAGDIIIPEGSWDGTTYTDMPGLLVQASNTSGTMFGLSAATYPNWAGNTATVGGIFTEDSEEFYLGQLRNRGGEGKMTVYLPEPTWRDRVGQHSAKRIFDDSYTPNKQVGGEQDFDYSTKVYGRVEHELLSFLADGEALMQIDDNCVLIGSRDSRLGIPSRLGIGDQDGEDNLLHVTGTNYGESYASHDLGVVNRMPSSAQLLTGITH